jgi:8-oxo-dGTP diphosphatase
VADSLPQHRSARLLIVDDAGRLLLFRYADGRHPPFWATAGGRLLPGESYAQAAARELAEETGFHAPLGPVVRTRDEVFAVADEPPARWLEHYFVVRVARAAEPDPAGWTDEERRTIRQARWWPLAELRATGEPLLPAWLPDVLAELLVNDPPGSGAPADPALAAPFVQRMRTEVRP